MKRVVRGAQPPALAAFREAHPDATWDEARDEAGVLAAIQAALHTAQGGLCAYCEIHIDPSSRTFRVEHLTAKRTAAPGSNLHLEWSNLIGVCHGGTDSHASAPHTLHPIKDHLSCDASKEQKGKQTAPLDPTQIPAFPCLFAFDHATGHLLPDADACAAVDPTGAVHALVTDAIKTHNLNCTRLANARRLVLFHITKQKAERRHLPPASALQELCDRHFRDRWNPWFTTRRLVLGNPAETWLLAHGYDG